MWDGKIRLFSPHNGRIYVGLLPYIKEYCTKKSIPYTIEEGVENVRNVIRENVREFAESLRPTSRGKPIQFRDYQIDAIWHAIKSNRCPSFISYCFRQVINNIHTYSLLSYDESKDIDTCTYYITS